MQHLIDLIAQFVERSIEALQFGIDIVGDVVFDHDARIVQDRTAVPQPFR
jgi:hypothetical protein